MVAFATGTVFQVEATGADDRVPWVRRPPGVPQLSE
jgi:hypothetical protein